MLMVVSTETVVQRLALPDEPSVKAAVNSALISAHLHIQSILQTPFDPINKAELFWAKKGTWPVNPAGRLRLRLSHGFVREVTTVMVKEVRSSDPTELTTDEYSVDLVKGIVNVDEAYEGYFIAVEYSAGFTSTNKAPEWLKEAILAYVPYVMAIPHATTGAKEIKDVANDGRGTIARMLEPYSRNLAWSFRPVI